MIRSENNFKNAFASGFLERFIHTAISYHKILTLRTKCLKGVKTKKKLKS